MRIPIYGIFGDNYVKQVVLETGMDLRDVLRKDAIEVDDNAISSALKIAAEIAKIREKGAKGKVINILPLSGNDKKPWNQVLKCYNFPTDSTLSEILSNFSLETGICKLDNVPSFIKPEFYEYVRVPGTTGHEKFKTADKVDGGYVIFAAAGWVLTRLGTAKVGNNEWVGVQVFTGTKSILYEILKNNENFNVPGVKPETAFAIWIAHNIIKTTVNVTSLDVYLLSDAKGQSPTTIKEGFTLDLSKLLMNKELINNDVKELAERALNIDINNENRDFRDLYIRIINLIYEVLSGAKRIEDLLYFTNRDLLIIRKSKSNESLKKELERAARYAYYLYKNMK